jgi:hypothetical protein
MRRDGISYLVQADELALRLIQRRYEAFQHLRQHGVRRRLVSYGLHLRPISGNPFSLRVADHGAAGIRVDEIHPAIGYPHDPRLHPQKDVSLAVVKFDGVWPSAF